MKLKVKGVNLSLFMVVLVERLEHIVDMLTKREMKTDRDLELLGRFRKQTVRRLLHLQDRARVSCPRLF